MIVALRNGDYDIARNVLLSNHSVEAEICLAFMLKYIVYSLYSAQTVAETIHAADDAMATGFNWAPPLSVIEFLGGADVVEQLVNDRLDKSIQQVVLSLKLLDNIPRSRYDFRKYFRAK